MAGHASDIEVMLKVKHGDREAFSVLVQRYRKPLMNFIYRFTANSGDSEDLAHEVFLKVFQSASKYEPKAGFSTWLYRIATNAALNHLRDHKPQLSCSPEEGLEGGDSHCHNEIHEIRDPRGLVEDELIEQERVDQIRKAVAGLPTNQRLALILTKYQELSLKETAEVLKCSEGAVKSLIFRAYGTLREKLIAVVEAKDLSAPNQTVKIQR